VIIHRAPFGSLERFIGVLIEHFAGEFPLWLAPVQCAVLPITDEQRDYAQSVANALSTAGIRVELDDRNQKIGYKIREWETKKVPFMLILGEKERASGTVAVRQHKKGDLGATGLDEFRSKISKAILDKSITI
jgi:threonyl-tRNA synthetase